MSPQLLETADVNKFVQGAKQAFQILISPQLQKELFVLKIILIAISGIFFVAIVYFLVKTDYLEWWFWRFLVNFLFPRLYERREMVKRWSKVKKGIEKDSESQWKYSLIEASNLLDSILRSMGHKGENLGEILEKLTTEDISNLDQVSQASKVCQDIARDPDYRLSRERTEEIINIFERAFKDLQIL